MFLTLFLHKDFFLALLCFFHSLFVLLFCNLFFFSLALFTCCWGFRATLIFCQVFSLFGNPWPFTFFPTLFPFYFQNPCYVLFLPHFFISLGPFQFHFCWFPFLFVFIVASDSFFVFFLHFFIMTCRKKHIERYQATASCLDNIHLQYLFIFLLWAQGFLLFVCNSCFVLALTGQRRCPLWSL